MDPESRRPPTAGSTAERCVEEGERPASRGLKRPTIEEMRRKVEREQREKLRLLKLINRLTHRVRQKERKLQKLQEVLCPSDGPPSSDPPQESPKTSSRTSSRTSDPPLESLSTSSNRPSDPQLDAMRQHAQQLKNSRAEMKRKVEKAASILKVYRLVRDEYRQQEAQLSNVLQEKEKAAIRSEAEVVKAVRRFHLASFSAPKKKSQPEQGHRVQMESQVVQRRRDMARELEALKTQDRRLVELLQTLHLPQQSSAGAPGLEPEEEEDEEEEDEEEEEEEEEDFSLCAEVALCAPQWEASESEVKLLVQLEALRETLGFSHLEVMLREIEVRLESERSTRRELLTEIQQLEEEILLKTQTLEALELQQSQIRFNQRPGARCEELKEEREAELSEATQRVGRLRENLRKSKDQLDNFKHALKTLYLRMSSGTAEGRSSDASSFKDFDDLLQDLLQITSMEVPDMSSSERDKLYDLVKKQNEEEVPTKTRADSPADSPDLFQEEEEEEEEEEGHHIPTRSEIKRSSMRAVDSQQKTGRGRRK